MVELNLFPTTPPSQDEKILLRGRRKTRIYLVLLMISVFILAVYTSLTQETVTVIKESPSISTYSKLFNQYPFTLQCPCRHIAVKYDKIITQFEPQYHPICSSVFVSSDWIDALYVPTDRMIRLKIVDNDFRIYVKTQFETVSKMCSLSRNILNSSLLIWLQTDFITAHLISPSEFAIQIGTLIEEFKKKTASQFIQTFKLIQATNHANQLATTQSSNWQFVGKLVQSLDRKKDMLNILDSNIAQNALQILALPQRYGEDNCSCTIQSNCSMLYNFPYRTSNQSLKQILPGFRIGCLSLDALFQSSFSCLYNQTCLDLMRTAIFYSKPVPVKILQDSTLSSQNITIETYLSQLLVTKWFQNTSFDLYFNHCAPELCQYSYQSKFNVFYFVTTIIALFGSLTDVLHFIISCMGKLVTKLYDRRKRNQVTTYSHEPNHAVLDLNDQTVDIAPTPVIATVEATITSIREGPRPVTNCIDRTIMIILFVLVIVAIITVPVVWLRSDDTTHVAANTSITTTMITTIIVTESTTTTSTNSCCMTLVYQPIAYKIGLGGKSLLVADFNKDSIQDLVVTNFDDHTISVLFGNRNGTFQMQQIYSTGNGTYPWGITTADFDNDTFLDLAVTLSTTNYVAIFFGIASNGSFRTQPHTFPLRPDPSNVLSVIEANDLNNDGFTDLLIGNHFRSFASFAPLLFVFNLGDGLQYEYILIDPIVYSDIDSIVIGDFDNDGKQNDVSICRLTSHVITAFAIYEGYRNGLPMSFSTINEMYEKPRSIIRGKFNNDELDDLAVVSSQSSTLQVLLAYGNGTFTQQIYSTDSYPTSVARINFNNDSIDDLAILTCNQTVSIYLGTKLGIFHQNDISFHIGENNNNQCAHSLRVADFNQDGKDDLVFIDPGAQSVRVLLGMSCNKHI